MSRKLFYFNPTCELEIVNGQPFYTPPKHLLKFKNDLATLPIYFGDDEDVVFIDGSVPTKFLAGFKKIGWSLPHVVNNLEDIPVKLLPLRELAPWGWSPPVAKMFEQFDYLMDASWRDNPMRFWSIKHKQMMSRVTGQQLAVLLKKELSTDGCISIPEVPVRVDLMSELVQMEQGLTGTILLKTPWSSSGRGLFKIRSSNEGVIHNNWIKSKFAEQGFLMAEPFLDKIQDLSFHFRRGEDGIEFLGTTFFQSEADGRFVGCYTGVPQLLVLKDFPLHKTLTHGAKMVHKALNDLDAIQNYYGFIGVDAMLFMDSAHQIKLHPCIEVNLRHTMGLLNIFLSNRVDARSAGFWRIVQSNKLGRDFFQAPLVVRNGLIVSGRMALTPLPSKNGFIAVLEVEKSEV